jgi:hypothetical protein
LLWQVVTVFAPELAVEVAAIFRSEFPDDAVFSGRP